MVTYFKFSGDTVDSVSGVAATNHGATGTGDRFGLSNGAYFFDGTDWMTVDLADLPLGAAPRTLSIWVRSADGHRNGNAEHIVNWGPVTGGTNRGFGLIMYVGDAWWGWFGGTPPNFSSGVKADTQWHNLVFAYDGVNMLRSTSTAK